MYYLLKKTIRDLWELKGQFLSVFIMAFLCMFIFSGIEGLWNSMETNSNSYFKNTNFADNWVNVNSLTNQEIEQLEKVRGIKKIDMQALIKGTTSKNGEKADFQIISPKFNNISKIHLIEGEDYDSKKAGIWLDSFYADSTNLKVGDSIEIEVQNQLKKIEIKGIIQNPDYIGYTGPSSVTPTDHKSYGYAVVGKNLFEELAGTTINYTQIKLILNKNANDKFVKKKIEDIFGDDLVSYLNRDDNPNITYFTNKIKSIKQVSILFSFIFLLLALLTIYSTVSRLVTSQRIQIGTFIAMGFSKMQILIHYLYYGLIISLVGTICGYLCSFSLGKMLINGQQKFHAMPSWDIPISFLSIGLILVITIICSVGAVLASYRLVTLNPALVMKNSTMSTMSTNISISKLNYEWNWVLRDSIRSKLRLFIGIIGVFGSVVLVLSAIGLKDSVNYSNQYVYGDVFTYKTKVNVTNLADIKKIENDVGGNGQWIEELQVELRSKKDVKSSMLMIVDEGEFVNLLKNKNNQLQDGEVVITKKLASQLFLNEKDKFTIKYSGNILSEEYIVSEILDIPFPQGIYMNKKTWEKKDNDFIPTAYLTDKKISKKGNTLSSVTLENQLESTNEIMKSINTVIIAMIAASVLLSIVILYNLGILKFVEKVKEYSTLKVLGFKDAEIFKLVFYDSLPPLVIGSIFGFFVGVKFMGTFVKLVSTDVRAYLPHLTSTNVILSLLLVVSCTLAVDYIVYRKVKKLDLVEALKKSE